MKKKQQLNEMKLLLTTSEQRRNTGIKKNQIHTITNYEERSLMIGWEDFSLSLLAILVGEQRLVTGDLEDDCEPFGEQGRWALVLFLHPSLQ